VRCARLVQSGDQPRDRTERPLARDHQRRPAAARVRSAALVGNRFERPHDGGANGNHAAAGAVRRIHAIGGLG
jgi:hypothetical protein